MTIRLADLAVRYGCELVGDPDIEVSSVATLAAAASGDIAFLSNPAYRKFLPQTRASAVILDRASAPDCPVACLIAEDPYLTYARIAAELYPPVVASAGIHSSACIAPSAEVPPSCTIGPGVVIGERSRLGERVVLGPNTVVGNDVSIGDDTRAVANVTLYDGVQIGARCLFHAGVVIGSDGFGIANSPSGWVKVPQVGSVRLGNDIELGANTTVDRGAIEDTVLGDGVKLDNLVQVGHNVVIGDHTAMASQSGVSGSSRLGKGVIVGGQSAIAGHLEIADRTVLMGRSGVSHSITKPGLYASVVTVEEAGKWRKIAARLKRLDEFARRLMATEKKVAQLAADKTEGSQ